MDENLNNDIKFFNKIINIYQKHKIKIYLIIAVILSFSLATIFYNIYQNNKNILTSEKYIEAGIYLSKNDTQRSKQIFEEIIYEKNKFYSLLSLNTLVEKNLVTDIDKVLDYFKTIESINYSREQKDLILFKKGLFLINNSREMDGFKLLKDLIKKDSTLKTLAEEILNK